MIRNLKALGLALAAVFAMSAVAASGASAAPEQGELTSTTGAAVTLTGTETGGAGANRLRAFGVAVECPGSTYTGHQVGSKTNLVPNGSTTATLTPLYKETTAGGAPNCNVPTLGLNWKATIDMKSCDYVIHLGKTTGVADQFAVTFDVVCTTPGDEITVTFWTNGATHSDANRFCIVHVPPQTGLTGAKVKDTTNDVLDLEGTVVGIKATKTGITPAHTALCEGVTHTENAQFDLDVSVNGKDAVGNPLGLKISEV